MVAGEPRVSGLRSSASAALERTKLNYLFVRAFGAARFCDRYQTSTSQQSTYWYAAFSASGFGIGVDWFVRGEAIVSIHQVRSINRRDCLPCLKITRRKM